MNKRILSAAMALSLMAAQVPMTSYAQGASMTEEDLIAALEQAQAGGVFPVDHGEVDVVGFLQGAQVAAEAVRTKYN